MKGNKKSTGIKGKSGIIAGIFILILNLTALPKNEKDRYLEIELPPVETVSTLTPKKISETSYDVSVISHREIEERGFISTSEILQSVSASISREYGNRGMLSSPSIRASGASHTLVLIDGKRVNIPSLGQSDLNKIPVSLDNIERIEVLKGPASALYGSEAIGGVINIVTKNIEKNIVSATSYIGSFQTIYKNVSANLRKNKLGFYIGLMHENSEGFRPNSKYETKSLNSKLQYFFSNDSILSITFNTFVNDAGSPGSIQFPSPTANLATLSSLLALNVTSPLLNFNLSFFQHTTGYIDNFTDQTTKNFIYTFDIQKPLKIHNNITLIAGAELAIERLNSINFKDIQNSIGRKSRGRVSSFMQIDWEITEWAEVITGSRYDNTGGKDQISPRASVNFKLTEQTTLGINYGHSFRVPTFNDLFWPDTQWSVGNPNLKPEIADEYEILLKYFKDKYNAKVNIFIRNIRDLIVWVPDNNFKYSPVNIGKAKTIGAGFENYISVGKLDIGASFDFFDPKDKTNNTKIRFAPKFVIKPYITYHFNKNLTFAIQYYLIQQYVVKTGDPSTYDSLDFKVSYKIKSKKTDGELFLIGKNIMDRDFQYQPGYPNPGAQFYFGGSIQF